MPPRAPEHCPFASLHRECPRQTVPGMPDPNRTLIAAPIRHRRFAVLGESFAARRPPRSGPSRRPRGRQPTFPLFRGREGNQRTRRACRGPKVCRVHPCPRGAARNTKRPFLRVEDGRVFRRDVRACQALSKQGSPGGPAGTGSLPRRLGGDRCAVPPEARKRG